MSLKKITKKSSGRKARRSIIKYRDLKVGSTFRLFNDDRVFVKICNAFSVSDDDAGKDIIPGLFEKVIICGFKKGYYPIWGA